MSISGEVTGRTKKGALSTMVATASYMFSSGANEDYLQLSLPRFLSVFPSFLQSKLRFSDRRRMAKGEPQCSP